MAITSLSEINLKKLIKTIEDSINIKLPQNIIEVSLIPNEGILYIRFKEPLEAELGEPIHPLIHIYKDSKTNEITALEIIDIKEIIK